MKKSFSMIVIAALLLGGCSKSELANQEPSGALIQARSALPGVTGEATRAPYIGEISSDNELVARVLTSKTEDNYANPYANGKMTFKGSGAVGYDPTSLSDPGSASFGIDDDIYYLVGLYPYEGDWGNPVTTTAIRVLDGSTDVMAAAQQETTYTATITNNNPPTLTFKHLLTKLEVSVKAKEDASILKWGKINSIVLTAINGQLIKNNVTITLADGSAASTAFEGSSTDFPFYGIGSDGAYTDGKFDNAGIDLTTTATKVAYSLIPPYDNVVGETPTKLTFKFATDKATSLPTEVSLPVVGYTQGRAYSITFTFDAVDNPILSSATVIPWENSGSAETEVH